MHAPPRNHEHSHPETQRTSDDQAALWNGPGGRTWVEAQELLDHMFQRFEDLLVQSITRKDARSVLDVGCGAGATTLAVARRFGPQVRCTGIDISEPMIAAARSRAERERLPATFIRADAQTHVFEPAGFDTIISRLGVMFFNNPVAAFTNLRRAATQSAQLRILAWRSAEENPFMTAAERAAAPLLPSLPHRVPDGPGQFAFADRDYVHSLLARTGWGRIDIQAVDVECTLPENELIDYISRLGPVGRALQTMDESARAEAVQKVRPAFDPFVHGEEIRFNAACWLVTASS